MKVLYFKEPKKDLYAGVPKYGGVSNVAYNLSRALAKNVKISCYPSFVTEKSYLSKLLNIYGRLAIRDFDIVHFNIKPNLNQGGSGLFKLAKISHTPTILNIHGIIQLEYELYGRRKNRWPWFASDTDLLSTLRFCKMANKIVTYSKFMRDRIVKWYGVNQKKIEVIPNGVDINKFSKCKSDLLLEGDPAILYLGHLSKGVDFLITAISRIISELPELKLNVVGSGDITSLKMLAKKKGIEKHVVFYGSVASEKTPNYYKAADVFVFPALRTPAGITILEAMASGVPVIASNKGGTTEILCSGENGLLFDPTNADELPKAILTLQKNPGLRNAISYNALKTVTKFSWENIAKRYVSLYKRLCE